jgi:drug/metabolite transporter (DMT)-like permease
VSVGRAGLLRIAALALVWGSGFFWIKISLRGFDPVQIVFVRLLLGCLTLIPVVMSRGLRFPRGWRLWGHLFLAALVANAIPYVLFAVGEQHVNSDVAGVISATTPLWTLLLAFMVGIDRSVTRAKGAGFGVGFLGVVVIFSPWRSVNDIASWGGLACLGAAVSYAVSYVYMGRYLTGRGITPLVLSASQLAAATVIVAVAMPIAGLTRPTWRPDAILSLIVLGVIGTGLAYVLNYRIIEDEGATAASTVTYLLPVVAILLGWLALNESVGPTTLVGVALVLAGVALTRRRRTSADAEA